MKKKYISLFLVLLLAACSPKSSKEIMTLQKYQETHVGMTEELLLKTYGYPLNITVKNSGVKIYEYVERFQVGATTTTTVEVRRYFFYIKDGKVISKQMSIRNQPAYQLNGDEDSL
jgi:hypothetical protein